MLVDILMKQMQVKDHQNPTNLTIHKIYQNYSNAWTNKKSQYCAIQSELGSSCLPEFVLLKKIYHKMFLHHLT